MQHGPYSHPVAVHPRPTEAITKMLEHADSSGQISFQAFKRIVLTGLKTSGSHSPAGLVEKVIEMDQKRKSRASASMFNMDDSIHSSQGGKDDSIHSANSFTGKHAA